MSTIISIQPVKFQVFQLMERTSVPLLEVVMIQLQQKLQLQQQQILEQQQQILEQQQKIQGQQQKILEQQRQIQEQHPHQMDHVLMMIMDLLMP